MKIFNVKSLSKDGKIIFKNFSYLSLLRVFNVLSQYLLVSYLVRILGGETYGVFVWTFSIIQYLVIIVNFGFNTFAAQYIAENRNDPKELNRIFSAIMSIKLVLFAITATLCVVSMQFSPVLMEHQSLFLVLLSFALGEALFPIWFFQGKENLGIPTRIVFCFKFLLVVLTFILISRPEDLLRYAILIGSIQLLIGISGMYMALRTLEFKFVKVTSVFLWKKVKEGFMFFVGNLFSKTFNLAVIFLAGILFTMEDVAGFDISFKIIAAFQLPFETLSMALFPTIARTKDLQMNQKIIFLAASASFVAWAVVFYQPDLLLKIMGGEEMLAYRSLLKQLSFLIPIVIITYFLGTNTLVAFGYQSEFNMSIIVSSIIYILILLILWFFDRMTIQTILYARILVDALMMLYRLIIARKHKLIFISR